MTCVALIVATTSVVLVNNTGGGRTSQKIVRVNASVGGTIDLAGRATLVLPPGALSQDSDLRIGPPKVKPPPWPNVEPLGDPVEIDIGAASLARPAMLVLPYDESRVPPETGNDLLLLGRLDESTRTWTPVPATVDAARHTISAEVSHFSVYGVATSNVTKKQPATTPAVDYGFLDTLRLPWPCTGGDGKPVEMKLSQDWDGRSHSSGTVLALDFLNGTNGTTPVLAPAGGVVVVKVKEERNGRAFEFGTYYKIDFENGWQMILAHLDAKTLPDTPRVKRGEDTGRIEAGQPLGYIGNTGWSEAPHLHVELRVTGGQVDLDRVKRLFGQQRDSFSWVDKNVAVSDPRCANVPKPPVSPKPPVPIPVPTPTPAPTTAPPSPLSNGDRLSLSSIGRVTVGMTPAEASAASGYPVRPGFEISPGCAHARPEGGPEGILFMFLEGRLARIGIERGSNVKTVSGAGIGSTEEEVKRLYPEQIRVEPHPYSGERGGHYLIYTAKDSSLQHLSLIFETDGQRVVSFRAGLRDAVGLIEGCA